MNCLDENTVVSLAEGTLGAAARATAEAHLDTCADCRGLVAGVARTFGGGRRTRRDRAAAPEAPLADAGADDPGAGARLGRYVLLHRLGEGGMGLVWAAYDPELNRNVAIKQVRRETDEPLEIARARLKREGQAMARLSHPNVVPIFDLFERDGAFFVAMEWVEGTTLRRWLEEAPRPWREIVAKFVEAGRGLAAAHEAGLIHRDFKPDNVFLGKNGAVRVGDFGLARELDATPSTGLSRGELAKGMLPRLTRVGAVAGTPAYMAPEQREGRRDLRSDQFSFCAALFEALTGRLPTDTSDDPAPPQKPWHQRPPRRVRMALARGLSAHPDDRFPTLNALLAALTADPWQAWRWPLAVGLLLLLVLGGVGLYRTALRHRRAQLERETRMAFERTWNGERALALERANSHLFTRPQWDRLQARLDGYASAAQELLQRSARSSRLELHHGTLVPEPAFFRRAQCVESARLRLDALATALSAADPLTARHALRAAYALPSLAACEGDALMGSVLPVAPEDEPRLAKLDQAIAQAEIQTATGHGDEVRALPLITEARALKNRPLEAQALLLPTPPSQDREANLYQAAWAAEASHSDRIAVRAWLTLAERLTHEGQTQEADRALRQAEATLGRGYGAPHLSAALEEGRGRLALKERRWTDAVESLSRARTALEKVDGPLAPTLSPLLTALAEGLRATRHTAEEIDVRKRALAILDAELGADDPALLDALDPLVEAELGEKRWAEALGDARRSLSLREGRTQGGHAADPELPRATYRVGLALSRLGRTAEARAVLERARAEAGTDGAERSVIQMTLDDLPTDAGDP